MLLTIKELVAVNVDMVRFFSHIVTQSFPMDPFFAPLKHHKTVRFSDVFKGYRKDALGTNELNLT